MPSNTLSLVISLSQMQMWSNLLFVYCLFLLEKSVNNLKKVSEKLWLNRWVFLALKKKKVWIYVKQFSMSQFYKNPQTTVTTWRWLVCVVLHWFVNRKWMYWVWISAIFKGSSVPFSYLAALFLPEDCRWRVSCCAAFEGDAPALAGNLVSWLWRNLRWYWRRERGVTTKRLISAWKLLKLLPWSLFPFGNLHLMLTTGGRSIHFTFIILNNEWANSILPL